MPEQITLAVPVPAPSRTGLTLKRLSLEPIEQRVYIELAGNDGQVLAHHYEGAEAAALLRALNTANLTANSLHKRLFAKLIADGVIAGSITGSPN